MRRRAHAGGVRAHQRRRAETMLESHAGVRERALAAFVGTRLASPPLRARARAPWR